ncbi:MAG: hypothetical protein M1812_001141 [Candelaria pacifica]|nr:MAG: hypothetical protein M1812_001141 [Candelaria pacifica]
MRIDLQRLVSPVTVPIEVPAEILILIFGYLAGRDIKTTRLVCKDFEAASSQYLFDRVYVSPQELHLEILTAVSQHPIFQKHIREIVYDYNYQEEHAAIFGPKFDPPLGRDESHARYCRHYHQQEKLIHDRADIKVLSEALRRMPRITTVSIIDSWKSCGDIDGRGTNRGTWVWKYPAIGAHKVTHDERPYDAHKVTHDERPYDVPLSRKWGGIEGGLVPEPWFSNWDHAEQAEKRVWGFRTVIRAMSLAKHEVRRFFIDGCWDDRMPGIPSAFLRMSPESLQQACELFRNLRRIVLHIQVQELKDLKEGNVAKLLGSAEQLEDLFFGIGFDGLGPILPPVENQLGTKTWSRLRTMNFDLIGIEQKDLVDFCSRHRATLKNVGFQGVMLANGKWSVALKEIRDLNLRLDSVDAPALGDHGSDEHRLRSQRLKAYLTGDQWEQNTFEDFDELKWEA